MGKITDFIGSTKKEESLEAKLAKVKAKLIKEGYEEIVALRKAEMIVFKPDELEKINLNAKMTAGARPHLKFFFDNLEDIKLVAKYFNFSPRQMAVKDSGLILKILKMLEELE